MDDDDPTLDAKLRHFIGIAGYLFDLRDLSNKKIAAAVGLSEARWTHAKKGRHAVDEKRLSHLSRYLNLEKWGLTFEVWLAPTLGVFKALLKAHRVGAYAGSDADWARASLMRARNFKPNGIAIERIAGTRAGGLAGNPEAQPRYPVLYPGDRAVLRIRHPGDGYLLVLNDCPDGETVCLMPSRFAPGMDVSGDCTRLPNGGSGESSFPVGAEIEGKFRLYAVWTQMPLQLPFMEKAMRRPADPRTLLPQEFRHVAEAIEHMNSETASALAPAVFEIRCADYTISRRA